MNDYLKNLPKSDENEELQQLSLKALKTILPTGKFLLRDERVDDKGVDASLEIKHERSFTNFRSQVQLKGTYSNKENKDGSVSYSVRTSNLNYLLNNPISLYLLYIQPKNEFRFVWAKDEFKRLNEDNPQWNEQENITLRFAQILDENAIEQIHERIVREGGLFRKINEIVSSSKKSKSKFEITSPNLELTDQNDAKKILDFYGLELLNTGYEKFVLEKFNLLAENEKKRTKFLLLKSRAGEMLCNYRAALDTLGAIDVINSELSSIESFYFESIENHCNWQLGQINTEQFLAKLEELLMSDLVKDSILDRFNFLYFSLYKGNSSEPSELVEKLIELKKVGEGVLSDNNFSQEMKVYIKFQILESELRWLIMEQELLNGESSIYEEAQVYVPEHWDRKENFAVELKRWVEESNELLNQTQNITIKADISYLQIKLWFHQNQSNEYWLALAKDGKEYFISKEISDYFIEKLQAVINIHIEHEQIYSTIRAKMLMVEILSLIGKAEESENLRKQINSQAKRMSYDALKNLTEFSLHKSLFDYVQNTRLENNKF